MQQTQYIVVNQTREREPTDYENLLGDALERIFAGGATEIDVVVTQLNEMEAPAPDGATWTRDLLEAELARLGA